MKSNKKNIHDNLWHIFFYGRGVFIPALFFKDKNIYSKLKKYISRNPHYFEELKTKSKISYYKLTDSYIEDKIGLFNALLYSSPKTDLEIFQSFLYLSLSLEENRFLKIPFVDFNSSNLSEYFLDNLEDPSSFPRKKIIVTIKERDLILKSFGFKVIVPELTELRSLKKVLMSLSSDHFASIKKQSQKESHSEKIDMSKEVDKIFEDFLRRSQS